MEIISDSLQMYTSIHTQALKFVLFPVKDFLVKFVLFNLKGFLRSSFFSLHHQQCLIAQMHMLVISLDGLLKSESIFLHSA